MANEVISAFRDRFGAPPEVVARVPGRINLMGRHVDHQGGHVNILTIDRRIHLSAGRSNSGRFRMRNVDQEAFGDFDFELPDLTFDPDANWREQVCDPDTTRWRDAIPLWTRYPIGAILRLYHERRSPPPALDIMVGSDLPAAAGLSSSSALTLGFVLAADSIFGWQMSREQLIQVTGEAEWFSGVLGGACAPAAMLSSSPGRIVRIGFFPFQIAGIHPFPDNLRIVLANSHDEAIKGEGARNEYNWRVACYRLAFLLLKRVRPDWFTRIEHLRDLDPESLGITAAEIYRALKELPQRITRSELTNRFYPLNTQLMQIFVGHTEPQGGYPLRDILLYGLAEMARSARIGSLLDHHDEKTLGDWLAHSHDGDRVSRRANGQRTVWRPATLSDKLLEQLAIGAEAGREFAMLTRQCGSYGASTVNVDEMVDLCSEVEGCLGAQIIGAGFGGSMIALARVGDDQEVIRRLEQAYFEPRGLPPDAWSLSPGSSATVQPL